MYCINKANISFDDFVQYSEIDLKKTDNLKIERAPLRKMMALYLSERIKYTGVGTRELAYKNEINHNRHYYGHKAAKDFLILQNQQAFTIGEVRDFFDSFAIQNYLNDLILNVLDYTLFMRDKEEIGDPMAKDSQLNETRARYQLDLIKNFEIAFLFLAEIQLNATSKYYTENLADFNNFDEHLPLVNSKYDKNYFKVPAGAKKIRRLHNDINPVESVKMREKKEFMHTPY